MGTKNNPGKYDYYTKAEPDEPMFILLARDAVAPKVVNFWCEEMIRLSPPSHSDAKIIEAHGCAETMRNWRARREERLMRQRFISELSNEELITEVKRRSMP